MKKLINKNKEIVNLNGLLIGCGRFKFMCSVLNFAANRAVLTNLPSWAKLA